MIFLDEIFDSQSVSRIFIVEVLVAFEEYKEWRVLDLKCFFELFVSHHIDYCKVSEVLEFKCNFIKVSLEVLTDAAFLIVEENEPRLVPNHVIGIRVHYKHIVIRIINPLWLMLNVNVLAIVPVFAISRIRLIAEDLASQERKQQHFHL